MSDDNKTIDLAALSPKEREAWEVCQKAQYGAAHGFTTEAVEKALANTARNLLPALLLKVARIGPLLEAAERVLNADLSEDIQLAEKILSEELAKWR